MKKSIATAATVMFLVLLITSCGRQSPEKSVWTGTMKLYDEKLLDWSMELDLTRGRERGMFLVGGMKEPIPEIHRRGDTLEFVFSEYGAAMEGVLRGNSWSGAYYRFRADTTALAFAATAGILHTEPDTGESRTETMIRLAGRFRAYFYNPDESIDSSSIASFSVRGDSVFGTFLAPDGDYGLLAGKQRGEQVRLHRFTGWQAMLIEMRYFAGRWLGRMYSFGRPPVRFTLEPVAAQHAVPTPEKPTRVRRGFTKFTFEGIDPEGNFVTSGDARFKGKALIVDIMGTWCHNCLDAAPVLRSLYDEFGTRGIEIVALSFEIKPDTTLALKNLALYRDRFDLKFPLLFTGTTQRSNVERRIGSVLENFAAYPTTLFIDAHGAIVHIHTGFNGPGTGEEYQREIELYRSWARRIAQEPSSTSK